MNYIVKGIYICLADLAVVDPQTLFLYAFLLISAIVFPVVGNILRKKDKNLTVWSICSLIPLIACGVHLALHIYDGTITTALSLYAAMYASSLLFPLLTALKKTKVVFHICAVVFGLSITAGVLYSHYKLCFFGADIINYSQMSYTDAYHHTIEHMKKTYVNADYKSIDFDAIDREVLPLVEKAEQEQDPVGLYTAMLKLQYLIPDGHVMVMTDREELYTEAEKRTAGNDYGFILFTVADGKTEAFMVEKGSDAEKQGIHSGTVITAWDGQPVETALQNVTGEGLVDNYPVADNEEFFKPVALSGKGGDEIEVSFLADDGKEKTVRLKSLGADNNRRMDAVGRFAHAYFPGETYLAENFTVRMLSDDIGLLKIVNEDSDNPEDLVPDSNGNYTAITELTKKRIAQLKAKGMKRLILDMRNNSGGLGEVAVAVASVFSDSTEVVNYLDGNRLVNGLRLPMALTGDGTYKDLPVTILTNFSCASAGDMLTSIMGSFSNVRVIGMTHTNCSAQPSGGKVMLPEGISFHYPLYISLDGDCNIEIDTTADRIATVPVELFPVNTELAAAILETDIADDAELQYVLKNLM